MAIMLIIVLTSSGNDPISPLGAVVYTAVLGPSPGFKDPMLPAPSRHEPLCMCPLRGSPCVTRCVQSTRLLGACFTRGQFGVPGAFFFSLRFYLFIS